MAKQGLKSDLPGALLAWYDRHARDLPWRVRHGRPDPYRVWLSEIMLQQTTVATVKAYFPKFLARWPAVEDLAAAPLDEVLKGWAGLGYYARARNLHACAKVVVADLGGRFPANEAELRKLPGIGPYTAAAIAAIAFDAPHAAVDGNVERVLSRLHAIAAPLPGSKPEIRAKAEALVPEVRAGDFAQALMDLGATICTPRQPACGACPWQHACLAHARGIEVALPARQPKRTIPTRRGVAFWLTRADGAVLLHRRPMKGLLGGMMEVPTTIWSEAGPADPESEAPLAACWRPLPGKVQHTFTHFRLELAVLSAHCRDSALPGDHYRWVAAEELPGEALPTLMRKVAALAQG